MAFVSGLALALVAAIVSSISFGILSIFTNRITKPSDPETTEDDTNAAGTEDTGTDADATEVEDDTDYEALADLAEQGLLEFSGPSQKLEGSPLGDKELRNVFEDNYPSESEEEIEGTEIRIFVPGRPEDTEVTEPKVIEPISLTDVTKTEVPEVVPAIIPEDVDTQDNTDLTPTKAVDDQKDVSVSTSGWPTFGKAD